MSNRPAEKKEQKESIYEAALLRGPTYFEYEDYEIPLNDQMDRYEVIQKIGRGKYSDVYKAVRTAGEGTEEKLSVLKILKPVRPAKIRREVKIMKALKHPSIISLEGVMLDECSQSYILALDYVETCDTKTDIFSLQQMKYYLKKLLEGLEYCHSNGVIHRDIKPQNVLIDRNKKELKIIDWGLADFYLPHKEFNVRVASRYYKGPELLLNNIYYEYSLDIWSTGCWFAAMMFRKPVFFRGMDNVDQLFKIGEIMGTADIIAYVKKFGLKPESKIREWLQLESYPKIPLHAFQTEENSGIATDQGIDLLQKMLVIDHTQRITAAEALKHPYLANVQ